MSGRQWGCLAVVVMALAGLAVAASALVVQPDEELAVRPFVVAALPSETIHTQESEAVTRERVVAFVLVTTDLRIGNAYYSGSDNYYFSGEMAKVALYDRALSAAELQRLYWEPYCMFAERVSPAVFCEAGAPSASPYYYQYMNRLWGEA